MTHAELMELRRLAIAKSDASLKHGDPIAAPVPAYFDSGEERFLGDVLYMKVAQRTKLYAAATPMFDLQGQLVGGAPLYKTTGRRTNTRTVSNPWGGIPADERKANVELFLRRECKKHGTYNTKGEVVPCKRSDLPASCQKTAETLCAMKASPATCTASVVSCRCDGEHEDYCNAPDCPRVATFDGSEKPAYLHEQSITSGKTGRFFGRSRDNAKPGMYPEPKHLATFKAWKDAQESKERLVQHYYHSPTKKTGEHAFVAQLWKGNLPNAQRREKASLPLLGGSSLWAEKLPAGSRTGKPAPLGKKYQAELDKLSGKTPDQISKTLGQSDVAEWCRLNAVQVALLPRNVLRDSRDGISQVPFEVTTKQSLFISKAGKLHSVKSKTGYTHVDRASKPKVDAYEYINTQPALTLGELSQNAEKFYAQNKPAKRKRKKAVLDPLRPIINVQISWTEDTEKKTKPPEDTEDEKNKVLCGHLGKWATTQNGHFSGGSGTGKKHPEFIGNQRRYTKEERWQLGVPAHHLQRTRLDQLFKEVEYNSVRDWTVPAYDLILCEDFESFGAYKWGRRGRKLHNVRFTHTAELASGSELCTCWHCGETFLTHYSLQQHVDKHYTCRTFAQFCAELREKDGAVLMHHINYGAVKFIRVLNTYGDRVLITKNGGYIGVDINTLSTKGGEPLKGSEVWNILSETPYEPPQEQSHILTLSEESTKRMQAFLCVAYPDSTPAQALSDYRGYRREQGYNLLTDNTYQFLDELEERIARGKELGISISRKDKTEEGVRWCLKLSGDLKLSLGVVGSPQRSDAPSKLEALEHCTAKAREMQDNPKLVAEWAAWVIKHHVCKLSGGTCYDAGDDVLSAVPKLPTSFVARLSTKSREPADILGEELDDTE